MHIPADWAEAVERIGERAGHEGCLVMVVGVPDVGKSTFCACLASRLHQDGLITGVVDADVGQSSIGPPAAISGGLLAEPIRQLDEIAPAAGYFVGSISPAGHLLPCVVGTQQVASRLRALGAQAIVVDTSGLATGSRGSALKEHKADLLQPSDLVLVQRDVELGNLAHLWQQSGTARVHLLRPSPQARRRTPSQRRKYRTQRFAACFQSATPINLAFERVALRGTRLLQGRSLASPQRARLEQVLGTPVLHGERLGSHILLITAEWCGRRAQQLVQEMLGAEQVTFRAAHHFANVLCGLLDGAGNLLAPVILHRVDFAHRKLCLLMPQSHPKGGRILHLGRILLRSDGVELGRLRPGDL